MKYTVHVVEEDFMATNTSLASPTLEEYQNLSPVVTTDTPKLVTVVNDTDEVSDSSDTNVS